MSIRIQIIINRQPLALVWTRKTGTRPPISSIKQQPQFLCVRTSLSSKFGVLLNATILSKDYIHRGWFSCWKTLLSKQHLFAIFHSVLPGSCLFCFHFLYFRANDLRCWCFCIPARSVSAWKLHILSLCLLFRKALRLKQFYSNMTLFFIGKDNQNKACFRDISAGRLWLQSSKLYQRMVSD